MTKEKLSDLRASFETAYIDGCYASNLAYKPQFVSNNHKEGKKVLSTIEDELLSCEQFQISVAFITMGGITPLLQTFKELERRGIPGEILTTNYLNFSEPRALEKLNSLSNITLKMYDVEAADEGFHTKGYIFKSEEIYRIIIGSSNITSAALTSNKEWNTKVISTEQGEVAQNIVEEFKALWNAKHALTYDAFYEHYKEKYQIIKHQREIAKQDTIPSIEKYRLQPNAMQIAFIANLRRLLDAGEERALLISATGTGKTYASAFAMRELGFKRVLFLVHRGQLARQTKKSYEKVFGKAVSMGLVGAGYHEYDRDYVFAMVQTLNREEHLEKYRPDEFDCIILDEAHHSAANTYQKVMRYFRPKLWLGMTATPDKRDDEIEGRNIYKIFHYQIAYEIRLQQAMEENLLCPFHYFGISDISLFNEKQVKAKKLTERDFGLLTGNERARHIMEQASYYGYSGDRVKGLVFCSRIDESEELSAKFNAAGFRTVALNGSATEEERTNAFERLAMDEADATEEMQPLDYIFSVEILNEGVDIVEVNQVIMLRPTESPIVFIQQLGRGLRKADGKEIDRMKGMKSIIRESYITLKNRLGRVPYLLDFYENGEVDPLVIIREYRTYQAFLESTEKELYNGKISEQELVTLEYLSKTILSGVRPYELEIIKYFLHHEVIHVEQIKNELEEKYGYTVDMKSFENAISVLQGFTRHLQHGEFFKQVKDLIEVGLRRYRDKFASEQTAESPFVLYEKYSRRDVSLLMNCGKDLSSTMYGMKRIDDDVFIFVTYHKEESEDDEKNYVDGKPDYADVFEDNMIFRWDSQIGRGVDSSYMKEVISAPRKHLLVKKSDAETSFYYMGLFDVMEAKADKKKDNHDRERDITKVKMKMRHAVRDDLLRYLQSSIKEKTEEKAG